MVVVGSGVLSSMGTTGTTQLTDKVDSPHSGLFKALHAMSQGNLALDFGGTDSAGNFGFSHTYTAPTGGSGWSVVVQGGVILNEGKLVTIADSSSLTLNQLGSGTLYHWIVVENGASVLSRVSGTTDSVVPDIPAQATPISLIKVQSTDTSGDLATQFFTTSKQSNSVSIGYDNSGEYAEVSSITGTADGLFISNIGTATVVSSDKVLIQDAGSSDVIKTATAGDIAALSGATALNELSDVSYSSGDLTITNLDKIVYANGGNAELSVAATTSTTAGRDLTISAGSTSTNGNNIDGGDLILKSGGGDGTGTSIMTFHTKVSGTDTAAERMRIHTNGNVGIGEASPDTMLHLTSGSDQAPQITLENSGTDEAAPNEPEIIFKRDSTPSAEGDHNSFDIGTIKYNARDHAGTMHTFGQILCDVFDDSDGSEDGRFIFYHLYNGTNVQAFNMGAGQVVVNDGGEDINFRIESDDEEFMFFVDAGNNRVSIGDSEDAPAATLEITNHATTGATGVPLLQLNSNDTDQYAVDINAANITEDVMIITADALTTGHVINISADALTTGTMFLLHSNSADTSTRDLFHIHNDHASATGTTALDVQNDSTGPVAKFEGNGALLAKVGLPETVAASAGSNITTHAGISGRATTVVLAASTTYTATTSDSGVVIVLTTTTSKVVLPDIPTTGTIGVQFTIINAGGGTISDGITTGDASNCKVNGSVPSSGQVSIADNETFTFIQFAADEWHKIG